MTGTTTSSISPYTGCPVCPESWMTCLAHIEGGRIGTNLHTGCTLHRRSAPSQWRVYTLMWAGQLRGGPSILPYYAALHITEDQVLTNSHYNENPGPGPPQHQPTRFNRVGKSKIIVKIFIQTTVGKILNFAIKFHKTIVFSNFLSTIKSIKSRMICFCSECIYSSSDAGAVTVADYSGHTSWNPSAISSHSQSCYCSIESSFSSPQEDLSYLEGEINSF